MSSIQAQNIRPPNDLYMADGTAQVNNNYQVLYFSGGVSGTETTSRADPLPRGWAGKWVTMYALGGKCYFGFSKNSGAVVDRTVAATNAGASASVAGVLVNNEAAQRHVRLPYIKDTDLLYFVRQSDTVGCTVRMELSSD